MNKPITTLVRKAIKSGNWIIRSDNDGASIEKPDFRWSPVGQWTKAPDWDVFPACGNGLHGQGPGASGFGVAGTRTVFCMTDGQRIVIDGNKLKVPKAMILLVNDLSTAKGLTVGGELDLSYCTGLTSLPEGLSVGGWLDLRGCTGLTSLPEGLSVGGSLDLSCCTGLTSLPEGLSVGGWLDLRGCTGLTSLPEGLKAAQGHF